MEGLFEVVMFKAVLPFFLIVCLFGLLILLWDLLLDVRYWWNLRVIRRRIERRANGDQA